MFPIHPHGSFRGGIAGILRWILAGVLIIAALVFAGCGIANPEMPSFTTILNIPFEQQDVLMADLVEDEDLLFSDEGGGLYIYLEGDSLRVALDQGMSVELESQEANFELGIIELDGGEAGNFDFDLSEIYPAVLLLPPGEIPIPPFEFELSPDPQDIVDVISAHVESGILRAVIDNQFQVPLSGPELPNRLRCEIRDNSSGLLIDTIEFPEEIAPGATASAMVDLSGNQLPDSVSVRILGGSPGHPGVMDVDPYRVLNITVEFVDLRVDEALAVVGEQSIVENRTAEIGDSLKILEASIASGSLEVTLGNQLPLSVQAELVFDEIFQASGEPVSINIHLDAGASDLAIVDLANAYIQAPGSDLLEELGYRVELFSPGSGGEPVFISATDHLGSSVSATEILMSECTGQFPQRSFELDPVSEELDLPEELAGVHFSEAILVLDIINELQIPAELQIQMVSHYASGESLQLDHVAQVEAADGRSAMLTRVILDSSNSILPEMLSGAPDRIELGGRVVMGGEEVGTASPGLGADLFWSVEAPLRASIEATEIHRDPFDLDLDDDLRDTLHDRLHSAKLITEVDNALPLELQLSFLVGADSLTAYSDPLRVIGPFVVSAAPTDDSGFVSESILDSQELVLEREDILALIQEGNFLAIAVDMPGSNGEEIAFRPSDYLAVRGIMQVEVNSSEF